jgi:hypothetical protein
MLLHSSLGDLDVSGRKFLRALLQGVKKDEGSPRSPEVQQAVFFGQRAPAWGISYDFLPRRVRFG